MGNPGSIEHAQGADGGISYLPLIKVTGYMQVKCKGCMIDIVISQNRALHNPYPTICTLLLLPDFPATGDPLTLY